MNEKDQMKSWNLFLPFYFFFLPELLVHIALDNDSNETNLNKTVSSNFLFPPETKSQMIDFPIREGGKNKKLLFAQV